MHPDETLAVNARVDLDTSSPPRMETSATDLEN